MPNNNEAAPRGGLFLFLLLDEKEPKNQGQNHRPCARPPKRLTFKSGSDFCKVKRKRPSLKVKRLVAPWATAAPRFGRARAPSPGEGRRSRTRWPLVSLSPLTTPFRPKPSSRAQTRDLLNRQRATFLVVALRIGSAESSICFVVPPRKSPIRRCEASQ